MQYLIKFLNIILGLFFALTVVLLIFVFSEKYLVNDEITSYFQYIGLTYIILLYIAVITLLIGSIIGAIYSIKKNGVKSFAKETILTFLGALLLTIILSLLFDKKILNIDKLYLPFVSLLLPSLVRFFVKDK
jgi:hypothetical protein